VSGPVSLAAPEGVERVDVRTAAQMFDAVKSRMKGCDVFFSVAAVADYRPAKSAAHKIKRGEKGDFSLALVQNPDILAWVAGRKKPPFCVGFAAETGELSARAREKRVRKRVPLMAANLAQEAIGADDNAITLYDDAGEHPLGRGPKLEMARKLVAHVAAMLKRRRR
jgi:phosphopantothenoylcysteine decarboxylase/phosphopantothenate--cysteine ligase